MKKRIVAAVLAAVLMLNIGGHASRASAAAGTAIIAIGVLAFNILGVMMGNSDDTAEGISCLIENGIEGWEKAFVGSENTPSWFATGWRQIYNKCTDWASSGEISEQNGKYIMKYAQYCELYKMMLEYVDLQVDFGSSFTYDYKVFGATFGTQVPVTSVPWHKSEQYSICDSSFFPVYYDEEHIYINADQFFRLRLNPSGDNTLISFSLNGSSYGLTSSYDYDLTHLMAALCLYFWYDPSSNKICSKNGSGSPFPERSGSSGTCSKWIALDSNGQFIDCSFADVDTTLQQGYISCKGFQCDFIAELKAASLDINVSPEGDVLDDLSDVLPLDKTSDPTLVIDTDPSIVNADDAVTVTDLPGEADVTLSELKADIRLDISIPTIIADKFPFCIPFDFIKLLSVLCADPVPPVFRIPISTDINNLEPFLGNETIGQLPEDFKPMIELDEEIVIDLSNLPLVQGISYTIFIVGFVVMLVMITPKLIHH